MLPTKLNAMGGGDQGHSQADDIASPIKLDIWWKPGQALFQLVLAYLEGGPKSGWRHRFATRDLLHNGAAEIFLLAAQLPRQAFGNRFK